MRLASGKDRAANCYNRKWYREENIARRAFSLCCVRDILSCANSLRTVNNFPCALNRGPRRRGATKATATRADIRKRVA